MKKHEIFAIVLWLSILAVLIYNIGVVNTILIMLAITIGSLLYTGIP